MEKKLAASRASASKTIFAAFNILNEENGKAMPIRELLKKIETKSTFTDWETSRYEKTGYMRWQSIFYFYSINCAKAGYLIKKDRIWYLTPEGTNALKEGEEKLFEKVNEGYRRWKNTVNSNNNDNDSAEDAEIEKNEEILIYNDLLEKALEGMSSYIDSKNPYEFQDLVAALLRGMGYYTPFIAPRGKDGGVDVIAYKDPLGTTIPRVQVQIKHRDEKASVGAIRELMGLLQKDGDVGIFVSTGGFSADAKTAARSSSAHIELIDLDRFIELWQNFYSNLSDQDKNLFPLKPIYFLDLNV
jgi:restriction system protein